MKPFSLRGPLSHHPHSTGAFMILERLHANGYEALFAGGCVRDLILGRPCNDIDIATSATPEQVEQLFPKTHPIGKAFGVILVEQSGHHYEVTTFRVDSPTGDGRRPDGISFSSPQEDAFRRDFTINALFYDPSKDAVIDHVGGKSDLQARMIRAVGDPATRFQEDRLRVLRALRFSVQLGFEIEPSTWQALKSASPHVLAVSRERVTVELRKMIQADMLGSVSLLEKSGLAGVLFPSWRTGWLDSLRHPLEWIPFVALLNWGLGDAVMSVLDLTRAERKSISGAARDLKAWQTQSEWSPKDLADTLCGARGALNLALAPAVLQLRRESGDAINWVLSHTEWQVPQLPSPWVRAQDLMPRGWQGAQLGQMLDHFYSGQLVGYWPDRESALKSLNSLPPPR